MGAGLQALQSRHVPQDDGTQWWLLLVSEQPCNRCLFNALWFNFLLFLAVRGGPVNLSYFFIMFVHSSLPVNTVAPPRHSRGRVEDRIYCPSPLSTCGSLKRKLVNGQNTIKQEKLIHPTADMKYFLAVQVSAFTLSCCWLYLWSKTINEGLRKHISFLSPALPKIWGTDASPVCPWGAWRVPRPQVPAVTTPHDECPSRGLLSVSIKHPVSLGKA